MNGKVSHADYYSQFVTPEIKAMVSGCIGLKRLLGSTDEHLNNIPLSNWDSMSFGLRIEDGSLCAAVCTFKQAARQIIKEEQNQ